MTPTSWLQCCIYRDVRENPSRTSDVESGLLLDAFRFEAQRLEHFEDAGAVGDDFESVDVAPVNAGYPSNVWFEVPKLEVLYEILGAADVRGSQLGYNGWGG